MKLITVGPESNFGLVHGVVIKKTAALNCQVVPFPSSFTHQVCFRVPSVGVGSALLLYACLIT